MCLRIFCRELFEGLHCVWVYCVFWVLIYVFSFLYSMWLSSFAIKFYACCYVYLSRRKTSSIHMYWFCLRLASTSLHRVLCPLLAFASNSIIMGFVWIGCPQTSGCIISIYNLYNHHFPIEFAIDWEVYGPLSDKPEISYQAAYMPHEAFPLFFPDCGWLFG
jgi:hypothetical protein